MTTKALREILVKYLQVANDKKVKAIYTMVEDEINTSDNDWDESFVGELDKRSKSFADGTAQTFTWEETKQAGGSKILLFSGVIIVFIITAVFLVNKII